ncbi:unnamed protein product [Clonostachys rosea]|uniref:Rhodopsin domain-containing protein n=1 Tax=Bionectria ochroleuca TaxID=29856 RepID=A0ABY6UPE6_BIOOC|nr:unnamed protein product [Clonostachys rosea]
MSSIAEKLAALPPAAREKVLNGPAYSPLPDGVVPNFANPENSNQMAMAVVTVSLALSSVAILLRVYARFLVIKQVTLADGLLLCGFGLFVAYDWCLYRMIAWPGVLVHMWDVQLGRLHEFLWNVYLGTNFYGSCLMCLKTGVLLEWVNIFVPRGTRNAFWWTCYTMLWVNVAYYVAIKFAENLSCIPQAHIWDKTLAGGKCINEKALVTSTCIINLISDVLILVVPQSIIWKLNMNKARKIGISIIFGVGLLGCVAAALRVWTSAKYLSSTDSTYNAGAVALCAQAEITLLILVACIPAFPKAFTSMGLPRVFSTVRTRTGSRTAGQSGGSGWPSVASKKQLSASSYSQIDEHTLLPLSKSGRDLSREPPEGPPAAVPRGGRIVRTMHFETSEEYTNGDVDRRGEAPWANPRSNRHR